MSAKGQFLNHGEHIPSMSIPQLCLLLVMDDMSALELWNSTFMSSTGHGWYNTSHMHLRTSSSWLLCSETGYQTSRHSAWRHLRLLWLRLRGLLAPLCVPLSAIPRNFVYVCHMDTSLAPPRGQIHAIMSAQR